MSGQFEHSLRNVRIITVNKNNKIWQTLVAILFFIVVISSAWFLMGAKDIVGVVSKFGYWAPLLLIILKVSTIIISPLGGTPIYFAVPALFGFWPGFIYLVIADAVGYSAVFWISRVYGRKIMNRMLSDEQILWADKMLRYMGSWKGLTIVRVVFAPLADTISYAAGLTKISFKEYFLATFPLLVLHVVITNNITTQFVKNQIAYVIVVSIVLSLSVVFIIFRKQIKKLLIHLEL